MSTSWISVREIASARSGDKGNHANIGVVAKSQPAFELLCRLLTPEFMHERFQSLGVTRTERFELPRVWALNFVLYDALAGGASQSLRIDTQGKLLGTEVLEFRLPVNAEERDALRSGGWTPSREEGNHGTSHQD